MSIAGSTNPVKITVVVEVVMVRIPTVARIPRGNPNDGQDQKESSPSFLDQARLNMARELVDQATPKILGRPPKSETEKRECFRTLAMLQNARLTYDECAAKMGVSRSTIHNWLVDPLYQTVQYELAQETRAAGFVSVGALVQDAIATLAQLMRDAKSEFVRYKAAEQVTKLAGMEEPQQLQLADDSREVASILEAIRLRHSQGVQVTVNVASASTSPAPEPSATVVESNLALPMATEEEASENSLFSLIEQQQLLEQQRQMAEEYNQPMMPGGRLPGTVIPNLGKSK